MKFKNFRTPKTNKGFSMIEVLIAILIVSVGLVGLALLQNMALKYSQSTQYRTSAVNLSSSYFEQIRSNRAEITNYLGSFETSNTNCGVVGDEISSSSFINEWRCQLGQQLGAGATATVERNGTEISIRITWSDSWWETEETIQKYTHTSTTQI